MGLRITPDLKQQLEKIGTREERSMSQVCEILLRHGVEQYKNEGPSFFQQLLGRAKEK